MTRNFSKTMFSSTILTAVAALGLSAFGPITNNLQAENSGIKISVNFAFIAGEKAFPAGTYVIKPNSTNTSVTIRGGDNRNDAMIFSRPVDRLDSAETAVVFHRYADRYYLHHVAHVGASTQTELPETASERDARTAFGVPVEITLAVQR